MRKNQTRRKLPSITVRLAVRALMPSSKLIPLIIVRIKNILITYEAALDISLRPKSPNRFVICVSLRITIIRATKSCQINFNHGFNDLTSSHSPITKRKNRDRNIYLNSSKQNVGAMKVKGIKIPRNILNPPKCGILLLCFFRDVLGRSKIWYLRQKFIVSGIVKNTKLAESKNVRTKIIMI